MQFVVEGTKTDIFRSTNACDACRIRKRKCDGKHPCSYCSAKNQSCEFSEKKKRGPKKRKTDSEQEENTIVDPNLKEVELFETTEASKYINVITDYIRIYPFTNKMKLRSPTSTARKVQTYTALAYAARLCGERAQSTLYINQARSLSGTIYDSPDMESVTALLMMCHYSMLAVDIPRSAFYSSVASNLMKLVPAEKLDMHVGTFCKLTNILSDANLPMPQKASILHELSSALMEKKIAGKRSPLLGLIVEFHNSIIEVLDYNGFYPPKTFSSDAFRSFDDIVISEDARLRIFEVVNSIVWSCSTSETEKAIANHTTFAKMILIASYRAIVNWRSNHIHDAIEDTIYCIARLQIMEHHRSFFGMMSFYPQLCVLGSLMKMLLQQGQVYLANQLGEQIKKICSLMQPDLDFICTQVDETLRTTTPITISATPPPSPISACPPFPAIFKLRGDYDMDNPPPDDPVISSPDTDSPGDIRHHGDSPDTLGQPTNSASVSNNNFPVSGSGDTSSIAANTSSSTSNTSSSNSTNELSWITDDNLDINLVENILRNNTNDSAPTAYFTLP